MNLRNSIHKKESGQALIIVMLIMIIAAIIATGVSVRTIADIQRVGRERASTVSYYYAESAVEEVRTTINKCMQDDPTSDAADCISSEVCSGVEECQISCVAGEECELIENFDDLGCRELELTIGPNYIIQDRIFAKDNAVEYTMTNQGDQDLTITWEGESLEISFVKTDGAGDYYIEETMVNNFIAIATHQHRHFLLMLVK